MLAHAVSGDSPGGRRTRRARARRALPRDCGCVHRGDARVPAAWPHRPGGRNGWLLLNLRPILASTTASSSRRQRARPAEGCGRVRAAVRRGHERRAGLRVAIAHADAPDWVGTLNEVVWRTAESRDRVHGDLGPSSERMRGPARSGSSGSKTSSGRRRWRRRVQRRDRLPDALYHHGQRALDRLGLARRIALGARAAAGARARRAATGEGIAAVFVSDRPGRRDGQIAFGGAACRSSTTGACQCNYGELNGTPVARLEVERAQHVYEPYPGGEGYSQVVVRVQSFLRSPAALREPASSSSAIRRPSGRSSTSSRTPAAELVEGSFRWQPGWLLHARRRLLGLPPLGRPTRRDHIVGAGVEGTIGSSWPPVGFAGAPA